VDETRNQVGIEPSQRICSNRCPKSIAFGGHGLNKAGSAVGPGLLVWHESYVIEKCDMLLMKGKKSSSPPSTIAVVLIYLL